MGDVSKMSKMDIPVLDDRIVFVNVTTLRTLNAKALRELKNMLVIQVDSSTRFPGKDSKTPDGGPLAVVMPYEMYKELQDLLWPMSVLPSWQTSPVLALAEEEDARAMDLSSLDGPTMPTLTATRCCSKCGAVANPSIGGGVFDKLNAEPVICPKCVNQEPTSAPGVAEAVEKTLESQAMRDAVSPIDVLHETPSPFLKSLEGHCAHCGQPNDTPLCSSCFIAGHRTTCSICPER